MKHPRKNSPPRYLLRFFRWFCHSDYAEDIEGDLHEKYERYIQKVDKRKANWYFFLAVLSLFRPSLFKSLNIIDTLIPNIMLRNNLKIAFRNLFKNKSFSIINIGGLALGMLVPLLIGLWIHGELSFNTQFENTSQIAQVLQNQTFNGKVETWRNQAMQLEPALRSEYGDQFKYIVTSNGTRNYSLAFDEQKITKRGGYMSPDITEMLSLKMLKGTRGALQNPTALLLSASTAKALFGTEDPMGATVTIDNKIEASVSGIYEDLPKNSSFENLTFILPFELLVQKSNLKERTSWGSSWFSTYVQTNDQMDMQQVSAAIKKVKYDNIDQDFAKKTKPELFLQPMEDWYLYRRFENGMNAGGRIDYVWLFGIIAIFVLGLACINFMNLSTARSEKRAKEVGIRKTLGSLRTQIIWQFYSESLLVSFIAFIFALGLSYFLLPIFNEITGKALSFPWQYPAFWLVSIGFTLFTGLLAGTYPSLYLSSFKPVKVLKGTFRAGRFAALPRKILVVTQFTVSISLIIGTIFVFRQIQHAKDRPTGYNRDNIVRIPINDKEIIKHWTALQTDLLNTGNITEMVGTDSPITSTGVTNGGFEWAGKDPNSSNDFTSLRVTPEFGKMVEWEIIAGRDFSKDFSTDRDAIILNEAAVTYMDLEDPIGVVMERGDQKHKIVGVVKNLITQSPYEPVRQTIFMVHDTWLNYVNIKIKPESDVQETLIQVENIFKKYDPENAFEYRFADETYARKFRSEERIGKLASFFAILAILISCLGLLGLASYVAEQRTKEIGIRKVLGASVINLWQLLSKEFILLVLLACLLATPLAYYFTDNWLANYTYRTTISWWVFAIVGLAALGIILVTVSYQALKAALMNPVKAIKSE